MTKCKVSQGGVQSIKLTSVAPVFRLCDQRDLKAFVLEVKDWSVFAEGKATRVASREVADAFVKEVQTALSGTIAIGYLAEKDGAGPAPGSGSQDAGDRDRAAAGMVEKVMKPQWFGMVPDHMSLGRYEAGLLPMIKWVVQGTFLCSVVTCDELIATTDMRTGDLQAKVTSKTDGVAKENFFMGTLGPGDFLYVPAGALTSVQANRGSSPGLEFEV